MSLIALWFTGSFHKLEQIQLKECKSAVMLNLVRHFALFLIQLEFHIEYTEDEDVDMKEAVVPIVFPLCLSSY